MKLQWLTNSIAVLEIHVSGFGPGWIVRMQMKTCMHRTLGNLMFLDKQCAQYVINIARARFLVYRHRTWEGNTGYALSCRPVNYT